MIEKIIEFGKKERDKLFEEKFKPALKEFINSEKIQNLIIEETKATFLEISRKLLIEEFNEEEINRLNTIITDNEALLNKFGEYQLKVLNLLQCQAEKIIKSYV